MRWLRRVAILPLMGDCTILAADLDAGLIDAFRTFFSTCVAVFGPAGTLTLVIFVTIALAVRRIYNDRRIDKENGKVIEHLERALQRANTEAREWRILFLRENYNWDDNAVERFIMQNELVDGPAAREAMEGARPENNHE